MQASLVAAPARWRHTVTVTLLALASNIEFFQAVWIRPFEPRLLCAASIHSFHLRDDDNLASHNKAFISDIARLYIIISRESQHLLQQRSYLTPASPHSCPGAGVPLIMNGREPGQIRQSAPPKRLVWPPAKKESLQSQLMTLCEMVCLVEMLPFPSATSRYTLIFLFATGASS